MSTDLIVTVRNNENIMFKISEMYKSGVRAFRVNFGRGNIDKNIKLIHKIKDGFPDCLIAIDIPGNKKRISKLSNSFDYFKKNEKFKIYYSSDAVNENITIRDYEYFQRIKIGDEILFGDNDLTAVVIDKNTNVITLQVKKDGKIKSKCGISVNGQYDINIGLTEEEKRIIELSNGLVDMLFVSFADTVERIRQCRKAFDGEYIISKIESVYSIKNLDGLTKCSHGLMLARGDLSNYFMKNDINTVILQRLSNACKHYNKMLLVATDYYKSLGDGMSMSKEELINLKNAMDSGAQYIISNETSFSEYYKEICEFSLKNIYEFYNV